MTIALKLRRGTTAENDAFTGQEGELSYDTEAKQLRVHDGATPGGTKVAKDAVMKGATSSAAGTAGLVPAPAAGARGKYLRGDGTWQAAVRTMAGATESAAGIAGYVPAPAAGAQGKYLRGDGTWQTVNANPPAISVSATTLAAGATATVTKSGTNAAPVFTFGIPQGAKGDKGDKGDTGPAGEGLSQIGAATLGSNTTIVKTGYGDKVSDSWPVVRRDAYGRVIEVGWGCLYYNCDCDCRD